MNVEQLNAVAGAAVSTFDNMLGLAVERENVFLCETPHPLGEVSSLVTFSGSVNGLCVFTLDRSLAAWVARNLQEVEEPSANEIADTVGELANIIFGAAKARLAKQEVNMSLPEILIGRTRLIDFPDYPIVGVAFATSWGRIHTQFALDAFTPPKRPKILVVDDDLMVLEVFRRQLADDFDVFPASAGSEALQLVRDNPIDIVISDYRMPNMNGLEVLLRASQERPSAIRMLVTSYSWEPHVQLAQDRRVVTGVLEKPLRPDVLRAAVLQALNQGVAAP
ncbi:MAG: response regulator [Pirellulaceae bacterium]|jgi:CheY-like chemotaxis protein/CheY-specific phosphatase CheX|nr:response regulator [Pirellulaceae bacterium]MDP7016428.1 response regulator [Pirellulaceae bacterium]